PPEIDAVRALRAVRRDAELVAVVAVVVRGVELGAEARVVAYEAGHPGGDEAGVRVPVDPVLAPDVVVAARVDDAGADGYPDRGAHHAGLVPALGLRLGAGPVPHVPVVVLVVVPDDVAFEERVVLRQSGVIGECAVGRHTGGVVGEDVVVSPDRVAGGSRVAEQVVVAVAAANRDRVPLHVVAAVRVDGRGGSGGDAGVAVGVRLTVGRGT